MACPFCGTGVCYDTFELSPAPPGIVIARRDVTKAALWANYNDGKSLKEYLETESGGPYARLWNEAEIQNADRKAISNSPGA